ncbi:hypothetical protein E2986_05178 [Frieseomelitta varia]|uniref:Uncharacterized protein n=1 Tax=Frieseomelitta varia TaxID=561572 RepID=A0A833VR53_9HYME|nr:hypothetical protein E2986_05178 [Frieseomelitta varia]
MFCVTKGTLQEMFEEVEGAIYRLEDLNEMLDLQNRQLDHRFQLALYKEKKLAELNVIKGTVLYSIVQYLKCTNYTKLADEHTERVSKYEFKQQKMMKERRETFDEVFKEELREYKATGSILKLPVSQQGPSLDEIVLDVDSTMFNEFLKN